MPIKTGMAGNVDCRPIRYESKRGRRHKEIDVVAVRRMIREGQSYEKIGAFFGTSNDTIRRFVKSRNLVRPQRGHSGRFPCKICDGKGFVGHSSKLICECMNR